MLDLKQKQKFTQESYSTLKVIMKHNSFTQIALAITILIVISTTTYTLMLPNLYEAHASISITQESPAIAPFPEVDATRHTYAPYFLSTQLKALQSRPLLREVSNRLNLKEQWGRPNHQQIVKILQKSLTIFQSRNPTRFVISVRRPDPEEAAQLANTIATTYQDTRQDEAQRTARETADQLATEIQWQEKLLATARAVLENPSPTSGPDTLASLLLKIKEEEDILKQLKMRYSQTRITLDIPRKPVEIINIAEASHTPIAPNLFTNVKRSIIASAIICAALGLILRLTGSKRPAPAQPKKDPTDFT